MTTPPGPPGPPGPDPQNQGGTPGWGQQPPSGQPVPPPGGYPPPQGQYPGQGQPQQPFGQPVSGGGAKKWLIPVIGGVVLLVVVAVLAFAFLGSATPDVGDCVRQVEADQLEIVDCDDDAAEWRVIGIQDGEQTYDEYWEDPETCADFPETVQSFWIGDESDENATGQVFCAEAA